MIINKRNLINLVVTAIISIIIFFLIYKQIIYPTIIPMVKNGAINLFADWSVILNANICKAEGFDVYIENPCDKWNRKHVYGKLLLFLPFAKDLYKFYFIILPISFNLIFVYVILNFFKFKNYFEYISVLPFVFSASVILAIERANIDIIIFLFVFLISINKKLFLNYILLILASISKFYPIVLSIIFVYEKKINKIFFNLILFLLIIFIIFFFQVDDLKKIFENRNQFTANGIYEFSFKGLANLLINIDIKYLDKNFNWLKYLYLFMFIVLPIIITISFYRKYIFSNLKINQIFLEDCYENRIYLLSTVLILVCYFSFSNYIYREIFFLGLLPWIIKQKNIPNNNNFINFYYYLICTKFLLTSIFVFLNQNNLFTLKPLLVIAKHSIDFYLIIIILFIFFTSFKLFLTKNFFKKI